MTAPKKPTPPVKARAHKKKSRGSKGPSSFVSDLVNRMENCPTAEDLNTQVITPFIQALVTVCDARGYVLNIYGENCNLAITPDDHAESVYQLIEAYFDEANLG